MKPHEVALTPLRFLEWAAAVYPSRTAIVHGPRTLTYAEFAGEVERMAAGLRRCIQPGDRVAVLAPNIPELLIAHYGVPLAGGVLVALNTRLARPEVQDILEHSGARVVMADSTLVDRVVDFSAGSTIEIHDSESKTTPQGAGIPYERFLLEGDDVGPGRGWHIDGEQSLISINYTSGTTGRPKGVMYSHRGAYLNALGVAHHIGYDRGTRYLWTLPMFHCNGWCTTWAITSVAGVHVCLRAVDGDDIWRSIDHDGITHLSGAPAVLSTIADSPAAHPVEALSITTGGAPPSPAIIGRLEALGIEVVHAYGLTEVYGPYTICEPQDEWARLPLPERAALMARQGVPMIQADSIRVVDDDLRDVPADGETLGEVVMRGHNVALGYFRDPEATDRAFAGGWFHSGDLGVMHPDRYIELKDRAKDIIISGGENISSIEVENALMALPTIADAAVVGAPDSRWGERPVAFVVAAPGHRVDSDTIQRQLREVIAGFKVPDRITQVETLPRTSTGKVQKHELRGLVDPGPDTKGQTEQ